MLTSITRAPGPSCVLFGPNASAYQPLFTLSPILHQIHWSSRALSLSFTSQHAGMDILWTPSTMAASFVWIVLYGKNSMVWVLQGQSLMCQVIWRSFLWIPLGFPHNFLAEVNDFAFIKQVSILLLKFWNLLLQWVGSPAAPSCTEYKSTYDNIFKNILSVTLSLPHILHERKTLHTLFTAAPYFLG